MTSLLLGEQLLHGHDIAKTVKKPCPIDADNARLVIRAGASMMPLTVDRCGDSGDRNFRVATHWLPHLR